MDCRVVVEAAVPVYDVETADEAVRIAISKTGEMLNPDLNYVEINMGERTCPHCGEGSDPAFIAADEGLVALELEMTVFNVERDEHAARIARKEIGQRLQNIPLEVLEVETVEEELEEDTTGDDGSEDDVSAEGTADEGDTMADEGDTMADEGDTMADEGDAMADDDRSTAPDDGAPSSTETGGDGTDGPADGQRSRTDEDATGSGDGTEGDDEDDILPEFEDLIDEEP